MNAVVSMFMATTTCGYAREMMNEALAMIAANYPDASELELVEIEGIDYLGLHNNVVSYDPVNVLSVPFTQLHSTLHAVYVRYYLKKLPQCALAPMIVPKKKKHLH